MKKIKNRALIRRIGIGALCIVLIISTINTTYSWISRKWSASLSQDKIRIEANNSIAFKLDENADDAVDAANLTQLISGGTDFVLKPVSNITGKSIDFFTLNRAINDEHFEKITGGEVQSSVWTSVGVTYGYIEAEFYIVGSEVANDKTKYVFLNPKSHILGTDDSSEKASKAIRVSLTFRNYGDIEETIIFTREGTARTSYTAISNEKREDGTYIMNGVPYYVDDGRTVRTSLVEYNGQPYQLAEELKTYAHNLSDYGGYLLDEDGNKYVDETTQKSYIKSDKCLFSLAADNTKKITVRIWLEGEDENCTEDIMGKEIDLLLSFDAATCEKSATSITIGGQTYENCYEIVEISDANISQGGESNP